jgi:hypothetical protein
MILLRGIKASLIFLFSFFVVSAYAQNKEVVIYVSQDQMFSKPICAEPNSSRNVSRNKPV